MQRKILNKRQVKNVKINDIEYFDVQDIKDNHPDLKIEVEKIVHIEDVTLIEAKYVHLQLSLIK
ncbi:hypothetical protein [Epilithonimonas arachidiradicis]|uniref:Uncharacterized protein n=1 Tax=Epilithonimonas arachidiradicis TaxID=1617282 RepID=A0A420D9J6_9FLAO|nr:hypothetical protein [Epilithonimonas arachidiradicis]RKE87591.1 hypothetical protein BXY58_1709 [Epilithonimonas arachidiradicis]GGG56390.1 hypothetical protein GCM10007332_17590 [Epilithonimonas arachidiradicis]